MTAMHLAELNVGRLAHAQDDPRVADFMNNLAVVNGLAERSPGFVWRLKGEGDGATDIAAASHPDMIFNLSVWESAESLEKFVWATVHKRFYARKGEWFERRATPHFVMWHVAAGTLPSLAQALERLEHLVAHGPSPEAFGWEGLPHIELWRSQRCA